MKDVQCRHPIVTENRRDSLNRKSLCLEASEKKTSATAVETKEKNHNFTHDPILQSLNSNRHVTEKWVWPMEQSVWEGFKFGARKLECLILRSCQWLAAWLNPNYLCPLFPSNVSNSSSTEIAGGRDYLSVLCVIYAKVTNYDKELYPVLAGDQLDTLDHPENLERGWVFKKQSFSLPVLHFSVENIGKYRKIKIMEFSHKSRNHRGRHLISFLSVLCICALVHTINMYTIKEKKK